METTASGGGLSPKLIVCLSGGGLRAMLFHLGTIRALRRCGLLENISDLVSVSGGSIVAAHLIANWSKYCGNEEEVAAVENEVLDLAKRDLRGRIVRRSLLTLATLALPSPLQALRLGPVEHLQREYKRFFRGKTFVEAYHGHSGAPELHVLATNLMTGELVSFSKAGYYVERDDEPLHENDTLTLAFAVAASSAFPPLFPPVALTREMLSEGQKRFPLSPQPLTDAGIYDNTGIEKALLLMKRRETSADLILLSDAGAPFDWNVRNTFAGIVSRNVRATDVLMSRVSANTIASGRAVGLGQMMLHCSIQHISKNGPLLQTVQKKLPFIRTDLDRFSDLEARCLVAHGEAVAMENLLKLRSVLAKEVAARTDDQKEAPVSAEEIRGLESSSRRKLRLFDPRDWTTWAISGFLLAVAMGLYTWLFVPLGDAERSLNTSAQLANKALNENARLAAELAVARQELTKRATPPPPVPCRDPSHGVERYGRQIEVTRESGWRGGGFNQGAWCSQLTSMLQGENPGATIRVLSSSESSKSTCAPFNCPQYNYRCSVQVQADPIYVLRISDACPAVPAGTR